MQFERTEVKRKQKPGQIGTTPRSPERFQSRDSTRKLEIPIRQPPKEPDATFFHKFELYDPRENVPLWTSKLSPNQDHLITKIKEFTNRKIDEYLITVRELRLPKKKKESEVTTQAVAYRLNGRMVMKLPLVNVWQDRGCNAKKYVLGNPSNTDPQKNILVIGAGDNGKSTLIDCVVNHALGVKWSDGFTLRVTDGSNQHKGISVYTIPSITDTTASFAMNIVDTPDLSTFNEKEFVINLRRFIKNPVTHGVDSIHAVWFVYNCHATKVSPAYLSIYKQLADILGQPLIHKITNVITLANVDKEVLLLQAIEDSGLPNSNVHFVLPVSSKMSVETNLQTSWSKTLNTLNSLTEQLENETPVSLHISSDDLEKRERAIEGLRQLNSLVRISCQKIKVMQQETHFIKERVKADNMIDQVRDFQYTVIKPVKVKRELPYCGEEVTNCSICFVTCHSQCAIEKDEEKELCCAMENGYCTVCPGQCYWDQHFNRAFQIFLRMVRQTKKFSDFPGEYKVDGKEKVSALVKVVMDTVDETRRVLKDTLEKAAANLHIISQLTGKHTPKDYDKCIDIIIHEEMRDGMLGWESRVEILKRMKEEGKLGVRIKGKQHTEKML